MDSAVAGHKGQTIGQLKAAVGQGTVLAQAAQTQRCLVDQLQGQPGFDVSGCFPAPATEEIPGPQPQVFRDEEPQADQVARNTIGEGLADRILECGWVAASQTLWGSR